MKKIYQIEIIIYVISSIIGIIFNYTNNDFKGIGMVFVGLLTPLIIPILFKIFKLKLTYEAKVCNISFIYIASILGGVFDFYKYNYFDKILHFSSGFLMTIIAALIFCVIKKEKYLNTKADYNIFIIFINSLNAFIAILWEIYEYFMLITFNNDCINHYTTGVHDSITDMICAIIAGLFVTLIIHQYYKNHKKNFVINLYEGLYDTNVKE